MQANLMAGNHAAFVSPVADLLKVIFMAAGVADAHG
jgi:hypothetical protein